MKNDDLKEIHKKELEILAEFIRVCDQIKVKYFLDAGTLLGAVRHKGFIPWDDDIDVMMKRDDYEKFKIEAPKLLKNKYFLQNFETDKNFLFNYGKIRDSETTFIETSAKNLKINHGLYIDIFILDNYNPDNAMLNKIFNKIIGLINIKIFSKFYFENRKTRFKSSLAKIILFPFNSLLMIKIKEKIIMHYYKKNSKYFRSYSSTYSIKKTVFEKEWLGEGKKLYFENLEAIVPEKYDLWLKKMYGDYMKLPPKDKRVPHHDCVAIDLKKSYLEYINREGK